VTHLQEEIKRENELIDHYVKEQMGLNAPKEKMDEIVDHVRSKSNIHMMSLVPRTRRTSNP
jgi:hypothetical protein